MKNLLTFTVWLIVEIHCSAQGIVDFENFNNSAIYTNSVHNGPATGLISGAGSYYFGLLMGFTNANVIDASLNNGTALANGGWIYEDLGTNTATPGLMNGNYTTDPGVDVSQTPGDPANFAVVGWSTNIGTTYGAVKTWWNNGNPTNGPSGSFAISSIAQDVVVGGGLYPVPTIFGPTPVYEIQGFTLNYYPMPPPRPTITGINATTTNIQVRFQTATGYAYAVQSTTNLPSGPWSSVASPFPGNGGIKQYLDKPGVAGSKRFYRVQNTGLASCADIAGDVAYSAGWTNGSSCGKGLSPLTLKGSRV